jgi:ubiquinone/menaquinone biosynthesis C-methylase UbiE
MDYDSTDIPAVYDRGRDHGPEMLQLWMNVIESFVGKQRLNTILDLGCGTGRFTEALAAHFAAEVAGIDPSTKMLEQAQLKLRDRRVRYQPGRGEEIPLANNSVDLIFTSMTFHHFEDPRRVAQECRRVLRDEAPAILRTGTRERIPSYPYLEFFPTSRPIMEDRLPTGAFICEVFEAAGFSTVKCDVVVQQIASDFDSYVEKIAAGADSVLAQLSASDFQSGLEAMRAHAARAENKAVCEPIDVFVFR